MTDLSKKFLYKGFEIIVVENAYNTQNGFLGMKRDVIVHLIGVIKDTAKIRVVVGICKEILDWKHHHFFLRIRQEYFGGLRNNQNGDVKLEQVSDGVLCTFLKPEEKHSLFHGQEIINSCYRWTIQVLYSENKGTVTFGVGVSPTNAIHVYDDDFLGSSMITKFGCCFSFTNKSHSRLDGVCKYPEPSLAQTELSVPDKAYVSIEINADNRTLVFFVNGRAAPYCITRVPLPVNLGVSAVVTKDGLVTTNSSGNEKPAFKSIQFRKMAAPTLLNTTCKCYECLVRFFGI